MEDKLLLHKVDVKRQVVEIGGKEYKIKKEEFPTVRFSAESVEEVYQLTEEEENVMEGLQMAFVNSIRLRQHIDFLYKKGSMYRIFNDNLLYHGCVPLDESGNFDGVVFGKRCYRGREYLDYAEHVARRAWSKEAKEKDRDFMWYLWCEESLHFPEEIRKPLSVLMCWMSRHGMKNQIHIINFTKKKRSAI